MLKIFKIPPDQLEPFLRNVVDQFDYPLNQVDVPAVAEHFSISIPLNIGVAYGAMEDDKPVGFLLGFHTTDLISGHFYATEFLWMTAPKHRKSYAGIALLEEFEKGARSAGCEMIVCGSNRVHKMESMRRLYQALGYEPFSEAFSKSLVPPKPLYPPDKLVTF